MSPANPVARNNHLLLPIGVYPMLYSFFNNKDVLKLEAFDRQVDAALANGAHGIAILGLGTEGQKLKLSEKRAVVETVAKRLEGRLPLSVTISGDTADEQIDFCNFALTKGAEWVILQPPSQCENSRQLLSFFGEVADQIDCTIGIQNFPSEFGFGLCNREIMMLNEAHPNIKMVKAETDICALEELVRVTKGNIATFFGRAGLMLPENLSAGAHGLIPGIETIDLQVAVYNAFQNGDANEVNEIYRRMLPAICFMMQNIETFVSFGKLMTSLRLGLEDSHSRLPAFEKSDYGVSCIKNYAQQFGTLKY